MSSKSSFFSKYRNSFRKKYENLIWTDYETLFKDRHKYIRKFFIDREVPFSVVLHLKFKRSLFGAFLQTFNMPQNQNFDVNENKLLMAQYDVTELNPLELQYFENENSFINQPFELLEKAVLEKEIIDLDFLYENMRTLVVTDTMITFIDLDMRKFKYLKILVLCVNWLEDIHGEYLPRTLEYLEAFANKIKSLESFAHKPPKNLRHVGFKRNCLTNDGSIQQICPSFKYILSLDLSENDIYNLNKVLEALQSLQSLSSLQLQGNPCSVLASYKTAVLETFPKLVYLDNTKLLMEDKVDNAEIVNYAAVFFTCHRIVGLPPPPKKEKGIKHVFYLEVNMPLLEDPSLEIKESLTEKNEILTDKKEKGKEKKKGKSKGKKTKTPYDNPNDQDKNIENSSFKTERFSWSKVMQLPEDALIIESQKGNYVDIRDTFRSTVNVKFIYLKVGLPQKKKGKKGKTKKGKDKKKKGKDKKKKGKDKKSSKTSSKGSPETPKEPPKENIVKKITMANFKCELHSINWSDKTIDFFWADHPKIHNKALEIEGSLRALKYTDEGGKKGKKGKKKEKKKEKGKKKGKKSEKSSTNTVSTSGKESMPKFLTIQVGFGLKRSYVQEFEHSRIADASDVGKSLMDTLF